ncbi:MAG: hypothetical protein KAU95_00010 [Candidatus Aenigmarchaeota archaeon]|nr:hypothetical protein [Candidatus Aenigmarchaeota archaeon]
MIYKTEFGNGVEKYRPTGQVGESGDKITNGGLKDAGSCVLVIGVGCGLMAGLDYLVNDILEQELQEYKDSVEMVYEDKALSPMEGDYLVKEFEGISLTGEARRYLMNEMLKDGLTETEKYVAEQIGVL